MATTPVITGIIIETNTPLTLDELANALHLNPDLIIDMVEHYLITPRGDAPKSWRFDSVSFKRAKIAASFLHDLEMNMPGIALALDLLARIEQLEQTLQMLKK